MKRLLVGCWLTLLAASPAATGKEVPRIVVDAEGHISHVTDVAFTRDGRHVVSTGHDKTIRVWDIESGKTVRTMRGWIASGIEGKIYTIALSPDDKYLAVGGRMAQPIERSLEHGGTNYDYKYTNAVRIFDFQTGELVRTLEGSDSTVRELAFSPKGDFLVSGDGWGHICVWTVAAPSEMKRTRRFNKHDRGIKKVEVSPDGRLVASVSWDNDLKLWNPETGVVVRDFGRQTTFAFSPDGRHIVTAHQDKRLLLWNAKDGEFQRELARRGHGVEYIAYSPDGSKVIVASGSNCQVLSAETGKPVASLATKGDGVLEVRAAPQGSLVASPVANSHAVLLWNTENGEVYRTLAGKGASIFAAGFARDGRSVAFGNKNEYQNLNNRGPLQSALRLSNEEKYDISFAGQIKSEREFLRAIDAAVGYALVPRESSWTTNVFKVLRNGQDYGELKTDSDYSCYTLTPDGRYTIIGTFDGDIEVYKTEKPKLPLFTSRKAHDLVGHTDSVWSLVVSPDSRTLVSGSADQTLRLWDIESGRNILTVFADTGGEWVAWTPEGYYASSLNGDRYIGWHVNKGIERNADYYPAAQFQRQYYRPDLVAQYLKTRDSKPAAGLTTAAAAPAADNASAATADAATPHTPEPVPAVDITEIIPPAVEITSPDEDGTATGSEYLTVRVVAIAVRNTPPVSELKLFLNGAEVASKMESQKRLSLEAQVKLRPGQNTLTAVAQSAKATSDPTVRNITYAGSTGARLPNMRVLSIGVSKYKHEPLSLQFAHKDAEAFEKIMKEQGGLRLFFNKVETKTILNEEVSRESVIRGLDWLRDKDEVKAGDFLLLFLSGHGGLSDNNYYFYTHHHDPSANPELNDVRWNVLLDGLKSVDGAMPILFVDTCRAEAAAGGSRRKGDAGLTQALKDLKNNYSGIVFFAASSSNEESVEMDKLGHGVFTYALLEGLRGKADLLKVDRIVYINELGNWVREQVKKLTQDRQHAIYEEPPGFQPFPLIALPP